jgi:hypothetical protein
LSLGRTKRQRASLRLRARSRGVSSGELAASLKVLPRQVGEVREGARQPLRCGRIGRLDDPQMCARQEAIIAKLLGRDTPVVSDDELVSALVAQLAHHFSIRCPARPPCGPTSRGDIRVVRISPI